jgi:alpha-D-xyloside xylohydrolase
MHEPVDWHSIVVPLDVHQIGATSNYIRHWLGYERIESGLMFHCELANGQAVGFRVDVVQPDVVRVRMNLDRIREEPSDMLTQEAQAHFGLPGLVQPFGVELQGGCLVLETEQLRLEFPRFPWHMRVFAQETDQPSPFFEQRFDDRAYGPSYEVPPVGFDAGPDGRLTVRETVAVTPGEAFYGFGERFTPLDKWGQELHSWTVDSGNVSSYRSYKNVPFFMSTAGYGLFLHSSFPIVYRMGSESSISYSIHVDDSQLDYFLIYGPEFKHILKRYWGLTGCAPVPPKWSFGFWISRCGYKSREEVESIIREMRARDFPCDVISLDPWWMGDGPWSTYEWDTGVFPDPDGMVSHLRDQGVRTCLWITPWVPADTEVYAEGEARGYFVQKPDGEVSPVIESFAGPALAAVDFTNPEAEAWFLSKLESLLDMGVAVFKSDFGEQAPVDAVYHDGRSGLEMHNLYPLLYNRAVFELTKRHFGRGFTWGRSAYAGSQRYPVQWGGDSYSSLDQMACQISGLLSYGMAGVPFCSHDVGGFDYPPEAFDHRERSEKWFLDDYARDPVVYARWLQFGVFSSHLRAHGKQPREPWMYGPELEEIARRYLKLRYRLLPYIYTQAVKSAHTGLPMVRPMVLEFQSDPNTYRLGLQYMFGDSFLVAPVVSRTNRCRVYLPAGDWVDYWTKEVQAGGRWIEVEAPLDLLPLWVRAGDIVPMGPDLAYAGEKALDPLTLELYQPQGEVRSIVHEEDKPDIPVRYERNGSQLRVEVGAAPGQVEIVLYGASAGAVSGDAQPLTLVRQDAGQLVRFDGTKPTGLVFLLEDLSPVPGRSG